MAKELQSELIELLEKIVLQNSAFRCVGGGRSSSPSHSHTLRTRTRTLPSPNLHSDRHLTSPPLPPVACRPLQQQRQPAEPAHPHRHQGRQIQGVCRLDSFIHTICVCVSQTRLPYPLQLKGIILRSLIQCLEGPPRFSLLQCRARTLVHTSSSLPPFFTPKGQGPHPPPGQLRRPRGRRQSDRVRPL